MSLGSLQSLDWAGILCCLGPLQVNLTIRTPLRNSSRNCVSFPFPRRGWTGGALAALAALGFVAALSGQGGQIGAFDQPPPPSNTVVEYRMPNFSAESYLEAVESSLATFEGSSKRTLGKGERGRVGLKVYSDSGPGLSTPTGLVEAVVQALQRRGYERQDIFIIGMSGVRLRESGFLPPLSQRSVTFRQIFVRALDSGVFYHEKWFYDKEMPSDYETYRPSEASEPFARFETSRFASKSFLPIPLLHEVDFWINLPCYSDHPLLGVNGALANATLWNASNTNRFLRSQTEAPVAVAEMGAIPELRETWALNIVSLERYQYIGGPIFNSLYTVSEPFVLLSDNPVMLDALMLERINAQRQKNGFEPLPEQVKMLAFSEQLGLGEGDISLMDLVLAN